MGIFEECLEARPFAVPGAKVDAVLASLNKEDAESLRQALLHKEIGTKRISEILKKRGYSVGRETIRAWRHREGINS